MPDNKTFDATLHQVEGPRAEEWRADETALAANVAVGFPHFEKTSPLGDAGAHLWNHALAWVPESEEPEPAPAKPSPPPSPPCPPPSVDLKDIGRELRLSETATVDELNRSRRRFCWENHPDRHPEWPDRVANRRVAIANMLIDRALELSRGRKAQNSGN
jgi:hypothetical protein